MTEDITKGKKGRKRARTASYVASEIMHDHVNSHHAVTPGHAAAEGHQHVMEASCGKGATGNPVDHVHSPSGSYADDRLSEPLTAGHASPSTGDHGAGQGRNSAIAMGHEDLRQSRPGLVPFAAMRSNGPQFAGQMGVFGDGGAAVRLDVMPAAERAGLPAFRAAPSGNPLLANGYRPARGSGTPANGGHDLTNVTSHAVASKGKTNLDIMKDALFGR